MIVAELFAKLGLQVDGESFRAVNQGVQSVAASASKAVGSVKGLEAELKRLQAQGGMPAEFFAGVRQGMLDELHGRPAAPHAAGTEPTPAVPAVPQPDIEKP